MAHTLECNDKEQLVVNIRELDCTTLVETAAALYITHKNGGRTFGDYCKTLENIRYRNGKANGYSSRLHYFSEWIDNNCRTGIAEDGSARRFSVYGKAENRCAFYVAESAILSPTCQ